jgi:hypothetical protein
MTVTLAPTGVDLASVLRRRCCARGREMTRNDKGHRLRPSLATTAVAGQLPARIVSASVSPSSPSTVLSCRCLEFHTKTPTGWCASGPGSSFHQNGEVSGGDELDLVAQGAHDRGGSDERRAVRNGWRREQGGAPARSISTRSAATCPAACSSCTSPAVEGSAPSAGGF